MKLSYRDRLVIEQEIRLGRSQRQIAALLGRNHSVISRELAPCKDQGFLPYSARRAELRAERLAKKTNKRKLDKDEKLRQFVVKKLSQDWSPEQIAGYLRERQRVGVCMETIYQFVYTGEWALDGKLLYRHLRQAKAQRVRHYSRKPRKTNIPNRISIHDRPKLVGFGHWESDTVFGRKSQPVSVQYEKKSQLVRLHKLSNQTAEANREAIEDTLDLLPESWSQTMTFDNGTENYQHSQLNLKTYFCDPYCAWQKGGVENINKLIRQYIPKKADLTKYTAKDIYAIQERLNNRPRKGLQYRTPNEILKYQSGALNSRT